MKVLGLITEYNPFHNGHKYHIEQSKAITGADYVIVVMSGNYVQRGTPAVMNKYIRTHCALLHGADLVIELPVHYAASSANYFAMGAVSLLDKLGIVDCICFGSEAGDLKVLSVISQVFHREPPQFKTQLTKSLREGFSYPVARNRALTAYLEEVHINIPDVDKVLSSPNNLLAIEYLKALEKRNSNMIPYTIGRTDYGYHSDNMSTSLASASAIRKSLYEHSDLSLIKDAVPHEARQLYEEEYKKSFPIYEDDFSLLLGNALLSKDISLVFDINKDLAFRIENLSDEFTDFQSFAQKIKSKNTTLTAVNRSLLRILLNITAKDMDEYIQHDWIQYIRVLGFKKEASHLLGQIFQKSSIPIISKLADFKGILLTNSMAIKMLEQNIAADELYRLVSMYKYKHQLTNEYSTSIVFVRK